MLMGLHTLPSSKNDSLSVYSPASLNSGPPMIWFMVCLPIYTERPSGGWCTAQHVSLLSSSEFSNVCCANKQKGTCGRYAACLLEGLHRKGSIFLEPYYRFTFEVVTHCFLESTVMLLSRTLEHNRLKKKKLSHRS